MQSITAEAQSLARVLEKKYRPEKIILFGSAARGQTQRDSDIDLLIIKKTQKRRPYRTKEVFELLRDTKRTYPLDPLVYTPEELQARLALGDYFLTRILTEGKVLYG